MKHKLFTFRIWYIGDMEKKIEELYWPVKKQNYFIIWALAMIRQICMDI